tara:strand:- start:66 stop:884 length:819 start_codon:yes stop_codon:yes gene_type:complete
MMPNSHMIRVFGGSTVLLTGAASGIGRALALLLSKCGATVHALDLNEEGLDSLVSEAAAIHPHCVDITNYEAYSAVVAKISESSTPIDFLFNNAGVTLLGEAQNIPFERWEWLLDINLMGAVNGTMLIYPGMIMRRSGHIVNTASIAGSTGYATAAAYTTSKAALLEFSRSLRSEAEAYGVRVSVACPGYVNSAIFSQDRIVGADRDAMVRDLPVKMMSTDEAAFGFLKGVSKGKNTIVFPFTARFLWFLSCWVPSALGVFQRRFMRVFQTK